MFDRSSDGRRLAELLLTGFAKAFTYAVVRGCGPWCVSGWNPRWPGNASDRGAPGRSSFQSHSLSACVTACFIASCTTIKDEYEKRSVSSSFFERMLLDDMSYISGREVSPKTEACQAVSRKGVATIGRRKEEMNIADELIGLLAETQGRSYDGTTETNGILPRVQKEMNSGQSSVTLFHLKRILDDLRVSIKYAMFDLEVTRRENQYLRQILEDRQD